VESFEGGRAVCPSIMRASRDVAKRNAAVDGVAPDEDDDDDGDDGCGDGGLTTTENIAGNSRRPEHKHETETMACKKRC